MDSLAFVINLSEVFNSYVHIFYVYKWQISDFFHFQWSSKKEWSKDLLQNFK